MKLNAKNSHKLFSLFLALAFAAGCGGGGGGGSAACTASAPTVTGANVMSVTVNGSQCSGANYLNEPCASVTICAPGTNNCQVINNLLLDTGSYGLRIFSNLITVPLTQETSASNAVVECAQFGSTNTWGPVQVADVYLGGEAGISSLPIQTINSSYNSTWLSTAGIPCSSKRDSSAASAGYNGILGVGLFQNDCASCIGSTSANAYFTCSGASCTASTMSLALQVQNPISNLSGSDNNGVVLEVPALPASCAASGAASLNGYLVMGIGSQSNNTPSGVTYFGANGSGEFSVVYSGTTYNGIIDSGSNGLFFPGNANIPVCGSGYSQWFCPGSGTQYSGTAVNKGSSGTPTGSVSFQVGQAIDLFNTGNSVFGNLGGVSGTPIIFDWGLPFFMGRTMYSTINGKANTLGTSPGWAY